MKISLIQSHESVPNIFSKRALELLAQYGTVAINEGDAGEESVKKTIKDAEIVITSWGNKTLTKEILDECPNLKLVVHAAGTVKPIVSDELWNRNVRVAGSQKPLGIGVAETALGFTISASKNFYRLNTNLHNGCWAEEKENIRELYEMTVGVISAGWAGRHYIKLLQNFDVYVLLYDPFVSEEKAEQMGCKKVDLKELLSRSDILSVHAPSLPDTYHMLNADTLQYMKKDAILINTSRGSVIDEVALYKHMLAGNFKYACLDVFDPEPPAKDNPLRSLSNVVMTPHLAGLAQNGRHRIGMHAVKEIEKFLNGERMECEITKEMLATMA